MAGIKKIAFFGHGRNLQAGNPHSFFERWKRFWATKTGWWFAYTPSTKAYLMKLGYPAEKITVFYNSIDISHIRSDLQNLREEDIIRARSRVSVQGNNVAVYVGGIYREKRIRFLLEAAVEIRKIVPDFELIVVGGGDEAHLITEASHLYDWIKYTGPLFGAEKTAVVKLAKVFLMPGLVGLAILDAFAYGIPLVTSDLPYHSPEIDYLDNGVNGVMTMDPDDVSEYAQAVSEILTNEVHRQELIEGGSRSLSALGIERMSERFAEGVLKALSQ
jgi:glycosyltransferase involved in cell wall biosynthesis